MATDLNKTTKTEQDFLPRWTAESLPIDQWDDLEPAQRGSEDAVERDEGYWTTTDNQRLFWQAWSGQPRAHRGTVVLMHGYFGHSARYDHVAIALVRSGYHVMAIDARGHGRSTGHRGHVSRFRRYVDDLAMLKRRALDRWPDQPLFALGHSHGGLIALHYALRKPQGVRGFLVTSPFCGLAMPVSPVELVLGHLTSRVLPTLSLESGLEADAISHLPQVVERYASDPLIFSKANTRWFTEVQRAMRDLRRRADELTQPFLFLVAGDDRIVDPGAAEALFHDLGSMDRELEIFPDLYHELLNEAPWRTILRRMILWMERHREPLR